MPRPRFFFATSRRARVPEARVPALAAWLDADPILDRPLPRDRPGLVLDGRGLCLYTPGQKPHLWHPGMAHRRLRLAVDPLVRLLDLRRGESALDCTLGLGHDALVLATAGARVLALETFAPMLAFTLTGLAAHSLAGRRVHARRVDHAAWLAAAPDRSFDHVYLDPMFPPDQGGPSTTWSMLRTFAVGPRLTDAVLRDALRVARRTVVLKLAPDEPAPDLPGAPPLTVEGSNRVHYGVWRVANRPGQPA